jgi:hypothetical protein
MEMSFLPPKESKKQWTVEDHKTQFYAQNGLLRLWCTIMPRQAAK